MAVHKVPLDVEADDKFLGPLSFKQFLFGGATAIFGYLTFLMFSNGIWPVAFVFLFPTLLAAVFAFPWSKEQPSELFLASRIRFYIKPRKRIWDQSGMKHLVEVTVPKQAVHLMTDGLNQTEVRSRFNALATMVDSRGWAVKNVTGAVGAVATAPASDRLVTPDSPAPTDKEAILQATPDVMDEETSSVASKFDSMIEQSTEHQKSAARDIVNQARIKSQQQSTAPADQTQPGSKQQDFWFAGQQNTSAATTAPAPAAATTDISEQELLNKAHEAQRRAALQTGSSHGTTISPDGTVLPSVSKLPDDPAAPPAADPTAPDPTTTTADDTTQAVTPQPLATDYPAQTQTPAYTVPKAPQHDQYQAPEEPVTNKHNPDILELAQSNDLNIETLARQVNKDDDDEVVISLH